MLKFKIERAPAPVWMRTIIPLLAVPVTFLLTTLFLLWAEANPLQAYYHFLIAPLSSRVSAIEVLVKATPLLLTGAAVAFAFSAGYWNIGAEGQLYAGAMAGAWLGMILKGISARAGHPAHARGRLRRRNAVGAHPGPAQSAPEGGRGGHHPAAQLGDRLPHQLSSSTAPGATPSPCGRSRRKSTPARFSSSSSPARACTSALSWPWSVLALEWFVLKRTAFGMRMRAVGLGKEAARFAGIKVNRTMLTAALVSGGIAGLAGVGEVAGIHFHLIESISDGLGYSGIIIATLGGLNPIGVGLAALFIGLIDTGAQTVSRAMNVPVYLGTVVQATLLLVTLGLFVLQNYRIKRG